MRQQGNLGRPWTPYEDDLLKAAVAIHGDNTEKWKTIALSVPGRTNKACRKRWLHSLSPFVKKSAWTADEDQLLASLFEKHPNKWSQIAREIPGRTDDACSKRYREALDPNLRKDEWTTEEDKQLIDALVRHGGPTSPKWGIIGRELCRSGLGCRNRWRLLERKRQVAERRAPTTYPQIDESPTIPQLLAEVWPLFTGGGPSTYWDPAWNTAEFELPGIERSQVFPELNATSVEGSQSEGQFHEPVYRQSLINANTDRNGTLGGLFSSTEGSFSYPASSLNDDRPERRDSQLDNRPQEGSAFPESSPNDRGLTQNSPEPFVSDTTGFDTSQNNEPHDFDVDCSPGSDQNVDIDPHNEPNQAEHVPNDSLNVQKTTALNSDSDATSPSCPLGTLAHAASTLSPSPCTPFSLGQVPQVTDDLVPPPRKRRRTAADPPAYVGMLVIPDLIDPQKGVPKLSSSLPVSGDPNILAYACGHAGCWPLGATSSTQCFSTSGALSDHYRERHLDDLGLSNETPFRCGLKGCSKKWKSVNGLQYHLQISKVHYQQVCSLAKKPIHSNGPDVTAEMDTAEDDPPRIEKLLHKCPHPGCAKVYKQMNGLRYHLLHGHPREQPAQLDVVPPMIARELGVSNGTETGTD